MVLEEPEFLGTERLLLTDTLLLGRVLLWFCPCTDSEGKSLGFWERSQQGEDGNAAPRHAAVPACF